MPKKKIVLIAVFGFILAVAVVFHFLGFELSFLHPQMNAAQWIEWKNKMTSLETQGNVKLMEERSRQRRIDQEKENEKSRQPIIDACQFKNVKPSDLSFQGLVYSHTRYTGFPYENAPDSVDYLNTIGRIDGKIRWADFPEPEGGDASTNTQYCFDSEGHLQRHFEQFYEFNSEKQESSGYTYEAVYDENGQVIPETVKYDYTGHADNRFSASKPRYTNTLQIEKEIAPIDKNN